MAETKRNRISATESRGGRAQAMAAQHAEELMALAVEAAQSRHLPDFLQQFAKLLV